MLNIVLTSLETISAKSLGWAQTASSFMDSRWSHFRIINLRPFKGIFIKYIYFIYLSRIIATAAIDINETISPICSTLLCKSLNMSFKPDGKSYHHSKDKVSKLIAMLSTIEVFNWTNFDILIATRYKGLHSWSDNKNLFWRGIVWS